MRAVIGVDLGTSATKVGLYDAQDGRPVRLSSQAYELGSPQPGWAEMEAETYWRAVVDGVRAVSEGLPSADIVGLGLSSQGQTFVVLDDRNMPLRPAIAWLDVRAEAEAREVEEWLGAEAYTRHTGLPRPSAIDSISKLLWLRRHEPKVMAQCARALVLPAYIALRLTGRAACDPSNGGSMGLLDRQMGDWWPEAADLVGLPTESFGDVVPARAAAGRLTSSAAAELGLAAGIPVAVGTNDQYSGALSVGNRAPGQLSGTLGTAMPLLTMVPDAAPYGGRGLSISPHPLGDGWFIMAYTKTAAACLSWLQGLLESDGGVQALALAADAVPPGAEGVTCLPHLAGMSTPSFDSTVRGGFLGLSLNHGRAHLARAAMEAVCYGARDCLRLLSGAERRWEKVTLTGGAASSVIWMGMLADVLGLPVVVTEAPEAACRGAALLGLLAAGDESAIEWPGGSVEGCRTFSPNPETKPAYDEGYERYARAMDVLYPGVRTARG